MTIYDIDQRILELVDHETGELLDFDAFADLQMEREKKIEAMALWVKDLSSTASAIKAEVDTLMERKRVAERRCESLKRYLAEILQGEKFTTPRCAVSFRKSTSVQVDDTEKLVCWLEQNGYDDCVKYKEPEVSKAEVGKLIKSGMPVPFAHLENKQSVGVK